MPAGVDAPLTIAWAQRDGPGILVRFDEIRDRNAAEPYRDRYLEADVARAEGLGDLDVADLVQLCTLFLRRHLGFRRCTDQLFKFRKLTHLLTELTSH